MNKLFSILSIAIMLVAVTSCSDENDLKIPEKNSPQTEFSNPIVEAARNAYQLCYGSTSRSGAVFYASDVVGVTHIKSRASSADTVFYIVNAIDGNGFVALTNEKYPEILAVSDLGTIKDIEDVDNPGLKMFLDEATDYAAQKIISGPIIPEGPETPFPLMKIETAKNERHQDPLCETQWGQYYPEGLYCPNHYCGCVVTATAQTLSYFKVPMSINLTYPNADKSQIDIDWQSMIDTVSSQSRFDYLINMKPRPEYQRNVEYNLGRLCRELGYRMDADYQQNGTGISLDSMASTVKKLCPSLKVEGRFYGTPILKLLNEKSIVIMQGTDSKNQANNNVDVVHAWVVDGYITAIDYYNVYYYDSELKDYVLSPEESYQRQTDLQHYNWGWNGQCNGYFNLGVFKTNSPDIPDTDSNSTNYDFDTQFSYFVIKK